MLLLNNLSQLSTKLVEYFGFAYGHQIQRFCIFQLMYADVSRRHAPILES